MTNANANFVSNKISRSTNGTTIYNMKIKIFGCLEKILRVMDLLFI